MTSYHGIRVKDTADLPIVLGTVMAPAFLYMEYDKMEDKQLQETST